MPGDYSRISFNPEDDFVKVQQQQGRLSLDSEWNLRNDILDRHARVQTIDTMGRAVVPRETPTGFQIKSVIKDGKPTLLIGPGRIYVDGIMVTNHGVGSKSFDQALEEDGVPATITDDHFSDYNKQPYCLRPATIPHPDKQYRVFLDVRRREVTWPQAPEIVEQAVGEETTARVQTIWQVKCAEISDGDSASCDLPDELTRPIEGRLSTKAVEIPSDENPCILPPRGGYGGRDNRLYRVEIHTGGKARTAASSETVGVATFKWSRDNGSVAASVKAIAGKVLTLTQTKRNFIEEFHAGDWIEILDDEIELDGSSGEMHRVKDVRPGTLEIELDTAPILKVNADTHTRTIRWDQKGIIRDSVGNIYANVDDFHGVIPVPPPEVALILEAGVQVTFSTAPTPKLPPSETPFLTQAHWTFAARTADASVERLDQAPPRGVHHHYVSLAIVSPSVSGPNHEPTFSVQDCRTLWPEERETGDCACTVCVSEESHNSGKLTIEAAINRVKKTGGTICLGPGTFDLFREKKAPKSKAPIDLSNIKGSVRLHGHGDATRLLSRNAEIAILVMTSQGVIVSDLTIIAFAADMVEAQKELQAGAVTVIDSIDVTIERCAIEVWARPSNELATHLAVSSRQTPIKGGIAIAIGGLVLRTTIRQNRISSRAGIVCLALPSAATSHAAVSVSRRASVTQDLHIEHNSVHCVDKGIHLGEATIHLGRTDILDNAISDAADVGITVSGLVWPLTSPPDGTVEASSASSQLRVLGNMVDGRGHGIVTGSRSVRVTGNTVTGGLASAGDKPRIGNGIVIGGGQQFLKLSATRSQDQGCEIRGNRVSQMTGNGIFIQTNVRSILINENIVQDVANSGILMEEAIRAKIVSVQGNQILNVGMKPYSTDVKSVVGIGVVGGEQVGIVDNRVLGLVPEGGWGDALRCGIHVFACFSIRIAGNVVSDVGIEHNSPAYGIAVAPTFERLDIHENQIRKPKPQSDSTDLWEGLVVKTGQDKKLLWRLSARSTTLAISSGGRVITFGSHGFASVPRGSETIAIGGNLLESPGGTHAANVNVAGTCSFANNRCIQPIMRDSSAVSLKAGALLITSNYVEGHKETPGMKVYVPATSEPLALTLLGNICTKDIWVNGDSLTSLTASWKNLNVLAR